MNEVVKTPLALAKTMIAIHEDLSKRTTCDQFEIYIFEQIWPSTSLGFGGIGGSAITLANTYVFICTYCNKAFVYFGEHFAYEVDNYNVYFSKDVDKHSMKSVKESYIYSDKEGEK